MATAGIAAKAYAQIARISDPASLGATIGDEAAGKTGPRVSARCSRTRSSGVVEAGHKSDAQAQALATGKANIVDVVTAVAETEVAVDALVSVRDKVIQAYEEIMKMPI